MPRWSRSDRSRSAGRCPAAAVVAALLAAALALLVDAWLFRRLRRRDAAIITLVIASFGASIALRSLLEFAFTSKPRYFTTELQIAQPLVAGIRATPDQLLALAAAAATVVAVHLMLTRSNAGRQMRAVSENPALAEVAGIDVARVVRRVWVLGAALAATAGVLSGLARANPGRTWGSTCCCRCSPRRSSAASAACRGRSSADSWSGCARRSRWQAVGAEWRQAIGFVVLTAVLVIRPTGLFGRAPA